MNLPTVEAARATMLAQVVALDAENVPLAQADGRWLAAPVLAMRDQPPFDASAMDGWAVRAGDIVGGATLRIVGESVAGRGLDRIVAVGETVRIFTGAPLPAGADRVVIQEEVERAGDVAIFTAPTSILHHIRPRGCDFRDGEMLLQPGTRLNPWRLALAASAGVAVLGCVRQPRVAILATGDELVEPGQAAGPDQIYNSATPALAAFVARHGGEPCVLSSSGDDRKAISAAVAGAAFDMLVTIGGASVGDHDLVKPALTDLGAVLHVEGVAMRPGKPVWFARLADGRLVLGLPGNPASALVCAELFLAPLLAALQGATELPRRGPAVLAEALPVNGPRDHYMRARTRTDPNGSRSVTVFADQDSSLVTVMAAADVLVRRPPFAPALQAGDQVETLEP